MWCGHIDYPTCGCSDNGPEDAGNFLEGLSEEEYEFAQSHMTPCPNCGEMRPKNDESLRDHGVCWMCHQQPERANSPVAMSNEYYFRNERERLLDRIKELEQQLGQ